MKTNGHGKLAKTFTKGGSVNVKEETGILNGETKKIPKSQMYFSEQRRCKRKDRGWGNNSLKEMKTFNYLVQVLRKDLIQEKKVQI